MPSHRAALTHILTPAEYEAIDTFCAQHGEPMALPALSTFLREQFAVELVTDPDIVVGFSADSSNLPGSAEAVSRPTNERECAVLMRACHTAGIPLTVSAGRSNLTGSATPEGGVVLATVNMLKPEPKADAATKTVNAPVGMILEDLRQAVAKQTAGTLTFPVDPTSRADASVGGAIACNASGFTPGEVGATRDWVNSIDFVLPNGLGLRAQRGEFISEDGAFVLCDGDTKTRLPVPRYPRPAIKNASGPFSAPDGVMDFVDLVIGSEGLFGLVAGCTLRLQDAPADYLDLFFSLPDEAAAVRLREHLATCLTGGVGSLTALEYFGPHCRTYMKHDDRLFHGDDPVAVYIQVPLVGRPIEDATDEWLDILLSADCNVAEDAILLLDNDRDRAVFLEARHSMPANAVEVVQHRGTFTIMTDTVVPSDRFAEFLDYAHTLIAETGMDYLAFGHLGDCHLHFTILPTREQLEKGAATYDALIAKSAELGGVYSGEHGTGKRKRGDFARSYGPAAVEELRRCKAAVDPRFLLNRGNVIPLDKAAAS